MKLKILQIRNHAIPCEVYESELKLDRRDKNPITLLTFVLKELPNPLLDDIAVQLWTEVARRYLALKKEYSEKSNGEVIGRISFECDGAQVEYEFSRLTKSALLNLLRIGEFVKQYPESEEIRISRDGPILVRFRNAKPENVASPNPEKGGRSKIQSWLAGLAGRTLTHPWRRER
jgi:hypothetical protein